jgi:hypothetical protein
MASLENCTPTVFITAGGTTYTFPSCAVTRDIIKNLLIAQVPKEEVGKDLLLNSDGFRLVGAWEGADVHERMDSFCEYFLTRTEQASFSWKTTNKTILCKEIHFDETPGQGNRLDYNIVVTVVRADTTT